MRLDDGLERGFGVPGGAHIYNRPPTRGTRFSLMSNDAPSVPMKASRSRRRISTSPANIVHQMENIPLAIAFSTIRSRTMAVS